MHHAPSGLGGGGLGGSTVGVAGRSSWLRDTSISGPRERPRGTRLLLSSKGCLVGGGTYKF